MDEVSNFCTGEGLPGANTRSERNKQPMMATRLAILWSCLLTVPARACQKTGILGLLCHSPQHRLDCQ